MQVLICTVSVFSRGCKLSYVILSTVSYKVSNFAGRMSWVGSWLTPGASWALMWMSYATC